MTEKINWSALVQVVGGPKLSASDTAVVEAYDKIRINIEAGTDKEVEIQPGGEGQASLLMIVSSKYSNPGSETEKLTYKVNDGTDSIELDGPHLLIGKGAVSLLDAAPTSLSFTNDLGVDVSVDILVGRDATPPEE